MLTKEVLKSSTVLQVLTEEQLAAIEALSRNDEEVTIGKKVKEIHDRYDQDIEQLTGLKKPDGVKSYENLKTQMKGLLQKAEAGSEVEVLKSQISTLQTEATNLKNQIESGSTDTALKSELQSVKQQLNDKESELNTFKTNFESEKETLQKELETARQKSTISEINRTIDSHFIEKKMNFKTTIPESMRLRMLEVEKNEMLKEYKPDYIESNGSQKLIFRNQEGEIVRSKENLNEPATAADLFLKRTVVSDMLDKGREQNGSGSGSGNGSGNGQTNLDLSNAKNQVEADDLIRQHILKNEGIARTDPNFAERHKEIRTENNVANMDVR